MHFILLKCKCPFRRGIHFFVCFLSNELIENETEFEEDTLDLVREDEMKVKLLTIYFNQL